MFNKFPYYNQPDSRDCGPTCLRMIARYYGKIYSMKTLRQLSNISIEGVSLLGLSQAAESLGFRTMGAKVDIDFLREKAPFPCIAHWKENHFIIVLSVGKRTVRVADPAVGIVKYPLEEFLRHWGHSNGAGDGRSGLILILEPTPFFYEREGEKKEKLNIGILLKYLIGFRGLVFQLFLGVLISSLLQVIFPYLTKSIVDVGIHDRDLRFIYLIMIGQLALFIGRISIDLIRNWILLHVSARMNVSLVSDFFIKLMKLPIRYFDSKSSGDIIQRINDQRRIEQFLTTSTLTFVFSFLSFLVLSVVLLTYKASIFFIFLGSGLLYFGWIYLFLEKRRKIDYRRFEVSADNSSSIIQIVSGMQEIKLNNAEQEKRWEWERIQVKLFQASVRSLSIEQYQQIGAFFINESKNILITILAARLVITNQISLGTMLSIQYIIGQLNSPIEQFIQFIRSFQDARISLERINEIHSQEEEQNPRLPFQEQLPPDHSVVFKGVSFAYPGAGNTAVLKSIDLYIPAGKTTAIVGMSGSGKTTLLKLFLKFYEPQNGSILVGGTPLDALSTEAWRGRCGVVMQDGFIFSDSIASNITMKKDDIDHSRLEYAAKVANINDFIASLPLGYNTRIGLDGLGLSQGQKQRILIARAVYKDPSFILFDEATNSLDANNEKVIMGNLEDFFRNRTVVVVAHRLSTVKHADQIIVLNRGIVKEVGTHQDLTNLKGQYFELVKNQLELDK